MSGLRFHDRTIVVTGGAMGIGAATVRALVDEGARVLIADRDSGQAQSLIQALDGPGEAHHLQVDLADAASIGAMGEAVSEISDCLHGLVNNAGIAIPASIAASDLQVWEPQVAINLHAPLLCVQTLLPALKLGPGHIVNISSEAAFRPRAENIVYDATKAAITAMTRSMAVEFASSGIRANTVAPGWTVTEMHTGTGADADENRHRLEALTIDSNIMQRLGRPEEIARAIVFLLSDDASFVTASTLHVDGGRVAN
jgi:NAD(P)-dependent dehydrogenase (short-subunit alcohol dehydrogenase family)